MVQTRPKKIFSQWVVLPGVGIAVVMAATAYPPALVGAVTPGAVLRLLFLFPAVLLLPGYLLDALLRLTGEEVTPAAPAVWLALSCGVLAPAGWAVLALHTSLTSSFVPGRVPWPGLFSERMRLGYALWRCSS